MTYLYLPPRNYNINALDFYMKVMEEAFQKNGEHVSRIDSLSCVYRGDKVIVITVNDCAKVLFKKRGVKVYTWYQGVAPEEMAFNAKGFNKMIQYIKWSICDIISLWGSRANIYVSNAMAKHYCNKYLFWKGNYTVMPCFNQDIKPSAFVNEKYKEPSFVYSGSVAKWQCFEETISIFVAIKKAVPNAKLTVLTNMIEQARNIVEKAGLKDVEIRNVSYQQLPEEMKKFKYGFLIRKKHKLNEVATPTKMCSYIGNGLIPIFSPVIKDFEDNFGSLKYVINAKDVKGFVNKIIDLERISISAEDIYNEYKHVFDNYYCRDKYVQEISELFKKYN